MTRIRLLFFICCGFILAPLAGANSNYIGPFYGLVSVDDQDSGFEVENGLLGIAIGGISDSGLGFEVYYAAHLDEDEILVNGREVAEAAITTFGFFAVYRTPGQVFLKLKGGLASSELEFELANDAGSIEDDAAGLAYGGALGVEIGKGSLELGYLVLPEFGDFEGLDFDADVDMVTLGYNWNF